MSLIIGVNLVDRIYMCADTRLSHVVKNGESSTYTRIHDNQQKLVPSDNYLAVGCVGSPSLGAFLLKKIKEQIIKPDVFIRELRELLEKNKPKLLEWIGEYLMIPPETEYKYAKCVLLFAGIKPKAKRKVFATKLMDLSKEYKKQSDTELSKIFSNKPPDKFTDADVGRLRFEMMKRRQGLKPIVMEGITKSAGNSNGEIELNTPDQFIFALKINAQKYLTENHTDIISFDNYEWGEIAVHGAQFDPSILPKTFFGNLDLNMNAGNPEHDLIWLVEEIQNKFTEATIGGSITNMILNAKGVSYLTHHLRVTSSLAQKPTTVYHTAKINGALHHQRLGIWSRLIPFTEQQDLNVNQAALVE